MKRLTYAEVSNYFNINGCVLLENNYKNARERMLYKCSCDNIAFITFDTFRQGSRCQKCKGRKLAQYKRLSQEKVVKMFKAKGCELLDNYNRNNLPVKYKCVCGKIASITLDHFKRGVRCGCGRHNNSGENHYLWNPDRMAVKLKAKLGVKYSKMLYRTLFAIYGQFANLGL